MSSLSRDAVAEKVREIAARAGVPEGIEIVDVEFLGGGRNRLLRIYIDRPDGITLEQCEFISRQVGVVLDVEDVVPGGRYTLEVSSPGLERKLSRASEFERFAGKKARVVLRDPIDNQRRWEGTLRGISEGVIALESAAGKTIRFPLEQVEKANLKFEW